MLQFLAWCQDDLHCSTHAFVGLVDGEQMCRALAAAHFFLETRIGAGELDVDPGLGPANEATKEGLEWKGERQGKG